MARVAVLALVACALAVTACGGSAAGSGGGTATASEASPAPRTTPTPAPGRCEPGGRPGALDAPLRTVLRVPAAARGHRAPLVVALHFATGTGRAMERQTGLTAEARRAGFVVAYPTATAGGFWRAPDEPKLEQTIAAILDAACIDPQRISLAGWSNGGGMASLTACRMAGEVAAIALLAPAVHTDTGCTPSAPVSVLEIHGTADSLVPYRDGRRLVRTWVRRDGCDPSPRTTRVRPRVSRLRWPGCDGDAAVEHLRLARGRHVELVQDLRAAGLDPAATLWRFLRAQHAG